jgi:hypothetical protein
MKKFLYGIFMIAVVLMSATLVAASETKMKAGAAELKKMSTFLSNFTELGFMDFDVKAKGSDETMHLGAKSSAPDLIRFGISHNYVNNFKSRITQCETKNCEWGSLVIDGKYVVESVKKYFDLDLKNQSVTESDPPYFYDGKLYHFEGADGEAVLYADVKEVFKRNDGTLRMTGEIYNADDETDRPAEFVAIAKPYKWDGKDTWAIISMKTEWLNE